MFAAILLAALPLLAQVQAAPEAAPAQEHTLETRGNWKSYGCHYDCYDGMNRYLPHFAYADANNNPSRCQNACRKAGFSFAGLQFGKECWCGNEAGGQLTADKDCWVKCKNGDNCGGPCRNYIWGKN